MGQQFEDDFNSFHVVVKQLLDHRPHAGTVRSLKITENNHGNRTFF